MAGAPVRVPQRGLALSDHGGGELAEGVMVLADVAEVEDGVGRQRRSEQQAGEDRESAQRKQVICSAARPDRGQCHSSRDGGAIPDRLGGPAEPPAAPAAAADSTAVPRSTMLYFLAK